MFDRRPVSPASGVGSEAGLYLQAEALIPQVVAAQAAHQAGHYDEERNLLNEAIVLYPDDPKLWILRGQAAESPLRAGPYFLIAHRMDPSFACTPSQTECPVPPQYAISTSLEPLLIAPRLFAGLGRSHHPVWTENPLAQRYFDQGMQCYYAYVVPAYVTNSAAACFHEAIDLDGSCAMAFWGLALCTPLNANVNPLALAQTAYSLAHDDRERRYAAAEMLGLAGSREPFLDALDGAILAYPDDIDLWLWRGEVAPISNGTDDTSPALPRAQHLQNIVFDLAAWKLDPQHPGPNHELTHGYENIDRPELGWRYAIAYAASAPNMPHAQHMLAHLATRLGRWDDALEATGKSLLKSEQGFPELDPSHHLRVRIICLAHEGMFRAADRVVQKLPYGKTRLEWARLLRLRCDARGLAEWARENRGPLDHADPGFIDGDYIAALVGLDRGNTKEAARLLPRLRSYPAAEVRARLLIETGHLDAGFRLFRDAAQSAMIDVAAHTFGGGGYFPEVWGEQALKYDRLTDAAWAFQEALAHDHGSVIGALGMQVLCERRGQNTAARTYAARAADIWKHADPGALQKQLSRLRSL